MTEEELVEICKPPKVGNILYWTSEVYGFGKYLRKYGYYPQSFPLNIYSSHGISHHDTPARHEYDNHAPAILFFSSRLADVYKEKSKKPCYTIVSPNVFYRRKYNVKQLQEAKGTIAFPCHSTPDLDDLTDFDGYAQQLKSLPEEFHPISVCLHYHDINKGLHKLFFKYGFEVLTVGHPHHPNFIERFYDILSHFKRITSNEFGSYTYYAVEMGIPFLLYGNPPEFVNRGDSNLAKGRYNFYKHTVQMQKALNLFSTFTDEVTPEQKQFVEKELGVYDSISRLKASQVLYASFLSYKIKSILMRLKAYMKRYAKIIKYV